ncbi:MAG: ABC transporter substrate-binding protein, partial [Cytophagales bacterium]
MHKLFIVVLLSCFWSCVSKQENKEYKIFRYNQTEGISSLDPAFANTPPNIWVCNQVFNGLVEIDASQRILPSLAEKWSVSADGLTYVFKLKKNIYFHDHEIFSGG